MNQKTPSNGAWSTSATIGARLAPQTAQSRIDAAMKAARAGKSAMAAELASGVLETEPKNASALLVRALARQQQGKIDEAIADYRACLAAEPQNQLALTNFGTLLVNIRQPEKAIPLLKDAVKAAPNNGHALHFLGRAYGILHRHEEALACLAEARRIFPADGEIAAGHARALGWAGRIEEALAAYDQAGKLRPDDDSIPEGRAKCLIFAGRSDEAEAELRQAIARKPSRGASWQELAQLGKLTQADVAAMREEIAKGSLDNLAHALMLLAMGSFFEKQGECGEAWGAYAQAAALLSRERRYDEKTAEARTNESIAVLERLSEPTASPEAGGDLIFIVGMPRSGTTLIEEILARHSRVFAAGERSAMARTLRMLAAMKKKYPHDIDQLSQGEIAALRNEYRRGLPEAGGRHDRFTDKLPDNAHHLALIKVLFPAAAILVSRRHPLDVCVSVLAQGFGRQLPYAAKLENIAGNMIEQERIISAWRKRFGKKTREIFYEDLVVNTEREARRIIEAAGLEWEPACLEPSPSGKLVQTPSAVEVRKPVYTTAIGRWKPFARHLDGVAQILRQLIDRHERELAARGIAS